MENFLYFADGNGGDDTTEVYIARTSMIASIVPVTVTTPAVYLTQQTRLKRKLFLLTMIKPQHLDIDVKRYLKLWLQLLMLARELMV